MDIPSKEPIELTVGDTWKWTRSCAELPPGTWTLAYHFKNATGTFSVSGGEITASGADFSVSVPAATTSGRAAGRYAWAAYASSGADRYLMAEGEVVLLPNFAAGGALETRTTARRMLDAIEAYLADPNNLAAARYSIGNRSLDRWPLTDLMDLRSRLRFETMSESGAAGGIDSRRTFVRFRRA